MEFNGITLVQTCGACPEQYDAYDKDGAMVGYLRLRHGYFRVHYSDPSGEIVYEATPKGDGIFESEERVFYLDAATKAIAIKINQHILSHDTDRTEYDVKMMNIFVENFDKGDGEYTESWNRLKKLLGFENV